VAAWMVAVALSPSAHAARDAPAELAYLAWTDGYWQVWVMDAAGQGQRQITRSPSDKTRVSWYPDGQRVLVSAQDGKVHEVVLASGQESTIALEQEPILDAVLSPSGQTIAYSFSTAIDGNDLWLANVDGSAARKLAKQAALQHEPAWAPDGSAVYFLSGDGGQAHDIWRVDIEGANTVQLTVGDLYHFDVAVAEDGALAYSGNRDGNYELYLQRAVGPAQRLTDDPALDARPTFAPEGGRIAFESTRSGSPQLWLMDLRSGRLTQLTAHPDGARAPAWLHRGRRP
jgi:TolB protein